MADNVTKIGPIFRGANGGLSDDLFTGVRNSFYFSNNIEIREDSHSCYPIPPLNVRGKTAQQQQIELGTDVGTIKAILKDDVSTENWLVFTENNVYRVNTSNASCTNIGTFISGTGNICDVESFNGYIYVSTRNYLWIIPKDASDSDWRALPSMTSYDSSTRRGRIASLKTSSTHSLFATDVALVIGDVNLVKKINSATYHTVETAIELQSDYQIKFMCELGGYVRIVADDGGWGSEILLWDKSKKAATEIIPLPGYKFYQACVYNGYMYLLSDKGLGLLNGYQFYVLKEAPTVSTAVPNGMVVFDDKLYFVARDGLYIYGAKNKNYGDVLGLVDYTSSQRYGAMETNGRYIMLSYQKGGANGYSCVGILQYENERVKIDKTSGGEGELQTMAYFGTSLSEIKQSLYLTVGYNIPDSMGASIKIFYRTDADEKAAISHYPSDWEWHELTQEGGLTRASNVRSPFSTTLKLNCRFQWIQFKFVLTNPRIDDAVSTKLYSADLYYDVMLQ